MKGYLTAKLLSLQLYFSTHIAEFVKKKSDIENEIIMNYRKQVRKTQAYKKHHLISTAVIPGVYNSPFG